MNKIILMGRLTKDPEQTTTPAGISRTAFTVAVNRRYKDSSGNYPADFIPCVAWREAADFIPKYFGKGDAIAVEGTLQVRSYQAQDGSKRTASEVVVEHVEFCGNKGNKQPKPDNEGFTDVTETDEGLPF